MTGPPKGAGFDLCGALRRIRRTGDLSQRELAGCIGISAAAVAHAEAGTRDLPTGALNRAAAAVGLRLVLVDAHGHAVVGMADGAVRDMGGRRFPAHLDTRYVDEGWWHGESRYSRPQPWYTFDRDRYVRDEWRQRTGTPDDHQRPQAGDSPQDRKAARQRAARLRREQQWQRRLSAGEVQPVQNFVCSCPPPCEQLDDHSGPPVHAPRCPCRCDVN